MRGGVILALALSVGLVADACVTPHARVDFSDHERGLRGADYGGVFKRWTRHDRLADGADTVLEVWGTMRSWEFREAYVERYSDLYGVNDADRQAMKKSQHEVEEEALEFVVVAQCWNYKWNDFNKASSPWRLTVIDGAGHELLPDSIHLERLPDLFEREFYPTRTPFSKTYVVRFKRPKDKAAFLGEASGRITLRFASPQGQAELVWIGDGES